MDTPTAPWRAPLLWRFLLGLARVLIVPFARFRVSGDVPDELRDGPLILAANHISPFDPVVLLAACRERRIAPRIMATGGVFSAPVIGLVMRHSGHIRVDRGTSGVARALHEAAAAVSAGSVVLVYPEGRIGLDPQMWPERGKTGTARLAFECGASVVPVAQWGAHEVLPYDAPRGAVPALLRALVRRPVITVHFAAPLQFAVPSSDRFGHARQATDQIIDALTEALVALRPDEPRQPRHIDPTRPTSTLRIHRPVARPDPDKGAPVDRPEV